MENGRGNQGPALVCGLEEVRKSDFAVGKAYQDWGTLCRNPPARLQQSQRQQFHLKERSIVPTERGMLKREANNASGLLEWRALITDEAFCNDYLDPPNVLSCIPVTLCKHF